jgi:hypothetical protein
MGSLIYCTREGKEKSVCLEPREATLGVGESGEYTESEAESG